MRRTQPRIQPLGDSAVTLTFGTERSAELLRQIHETAALIASSGLVEIEDVVPAYLGLAVFYESQKITHAEIARRLLELCETMLAPSSSPPRIAAREHEIPVVYDGPDLADVAKALNLTIDDVVERHSARSYSVDVIGFVPGFAYLSELEPSLQLPRRTNPRPRVEAGSVAIAAAHTGIYPLDTPGGWHLIGHTSTVMFDPARDPPALLRAGDSVRFLPRQ